MLFGTLRHDRPCGMIMASVTGRAFVLFSFVAVSFGVRPKYRPDYETYHNYTTILSIIEQWANSSELHGILRVERSAVRTHLGQQIPIVRLTDFSRKLAANGREKMKVVPSYCVSFPSLSTGSADVRRARKRADRRGELPRTCTEPHVSVLGTLLVARWPNGPSHPGEC